MQLVYCYAYGYRILRVVFILVLNKQRLPDPRLNPSGVKKEKKSDHPQLLSLFNLPSSNRKSDVLLKLLKPADLPS